VLWQRCQLSPKFPDYWQTMFTTQLVAAIYVHLF
jgi:hypothetical protein